MAKAEAHSAFSHMLANSLMADSPEPELDPGFDIVEPAQVSCPLVFSSPHSGCVYPRRFLAATRLDALTLRRSEDAHVDALFASAQVLGAPLLRAHFPRAYLDVNREPYELDPRMFDGRLPGFANIRSLRVAGGLGTIARIVGEAQDIYFRRWPVEEALARIDGLYKPYHRRLHGLMQRARAEFGLSILLDCHSMPASAAAWEVSGSPPATRSADIVLGDRYGTSCDPAIIDLVDYQLRARGYMVRRNKPYAGGFITEHYGAPGNGWHAVQIEVNRGLYMDERNMQRHAGFAGLARDLGEMAQALADFAVSGLGRLRMAAE